MSSTYGILPHYPLTNEAANDARKVNANLQALETYAHGKQSGATNLTALASVTGATNTVLLFTGVNTMAAGKVTGDYVSTAATVQVAGLGVGAAAPVSGIQVAGLISGVSAAFTSKVIVSGTFVASAAADIVGKATVTGTFVASGVADITGQCTLGGKATVAGTFVASGVADVTGNLTCSAVVRATQFGAGGAPSYPVHVHVNGGSSNNNVCCLLEAGNTATYYGNSQLAAGFNNLADYAHTIRTRHNGSAQASNAWDFFVWNYGSAASSMVGTWAMSVEAAIVSAAGNVNTLRGYQCSGTTGLGGVLVLDDGANWRVTLTFKGGILTGQSIAASSAATATWA